MNRKKRWSQLRPYLREDRGTWEILIPGSLSGGKRKRISFPDIESAETWIAEKSLAQAQGKSVGLTVRAASGAMTVAELVALLLKEKSSRQSVRAVTTLKHRLEKFRLAFGPRPADEVNPWAAKRWLDGLKLSQRSRFGVFSECRSLYRWAIRYQFLRENPFDQMEPEHKGRAAKSILTPEEMRQLLACEMTDWFRAWIALGGFAGLRTIEIKRLDWIAVHRSERQIHVGEDVIKRTRGMRHRYVEITPACLRHLPAGRTGPVVTMGRTGFVLECQRVCRQMDWSRWPQNALRHSFASYHLAQWQDSGKTAHQLGHTSSEMVYSNYAEAVTKRQAREWWVI